MNYELTDDQAQTLASEQPELMVNINIGINDMLNNCYYKRDGEASVSSRIVGGAPALPGAVINTCNRYNLLKVNNLSNQVFIHGWYRCVYQIH